MIEAKTFSGLKVLLTGQTGFKGSWLALWLDALGAQVTGLALSPETSPNLFEGAGIAGILDSRIADLRDPRAVGDIVDEIAPDLVFHLAAQPLVRRSYAEPLQTFATNVMGTAHLLDAVRRRGGTRAVVVVTTDKCYENREWVWPYRETEALGGYDPYSASKACAEIVAASFRQSYFAADRFAEHGTALATARAGNVIGGGDWSQDRLIPDVIRSFEAGKKVLVRNPDSVRPWQHVLESLFGYLLLAQSLLRDGPIHAEAFNFGPYDADTLPVREVLRLMGEAWGANPGWELDGREKPHEAHLLRLDSSKARHALGWRPRLSVGEAVQWTAEWYAKVLAGADMRQLTLQQIDQFTRKEA